MAHHAHRPRASRLLLLAHGSPRPGWRAPLDALLAELQRRAGPDAVALAFLAHDAPSLREAAAVARSDGVEELRVLPLFISGGGHVLVDLPRRCEEIRASWPDMSLELLPAVGQHRRVIAAIAAIALQPGRG